MKIFRTKNAHANFWLDVVLITAILACICYIFFWPIRVAGNSMSPTVNVGDQLIVSRFLGFIGNYSHGDLVLAHVEIDGATETIIKRVAAIPGDHFVLDDIDIILADGEYFLLGDNTTISKGSRHFGPVNASQISGRILLRYFPLTAIEIF